jgi:hypothetical protein
MCFRALSDPDDVVHRVWVTVILGILKRAPIDGDRAELTATRRCG